MFYNCVQKLPVADVLQNKNLFKISQYSQENACVGVSFETLLKGDSGTGVFPTCCCFYFHSTGQIRKAWRKEWGKIFQMKEENENISFNVYLQVLVLVVTEMQYNYINIETAHPFSYFFSKYSFFCFPRIHLCVFLFRLAN